MTDKLSQIRERCDKATPAPWKDGEVIDRFGDNDAWCYCVTDPDDYHIIAHVNCESDEYAEAEKEERAKADAAFIREARTDIPYLLDRVAELETQLAACESTNELHKSNIATQAKRIEALETVLAHEKSRNRVGGDNFEAQRNQLILHQSTELSYLERAEAAESRLAAAEELARQSQDALEILAALDISVEWELAPPIKRRIKTVTQELMKGLSTFRETK